MAEPDEARAIAAQLTAAAEALVDRGEDATAAWTAATDAWMAAADAEVDLAAAERAARIAPITRLRAPAPHLARAWDRVAEVGERAAEAARVAEQATALMLDCALDFDGAPEAVARARVVERAAWAEWIDADDAYRAALAGYLAADR